jgi:hypothetical protein
MKLSLSEDNEQDLEAIFLGDGWTVYPEILLRCAGFTASKLLDLSCPSVAAQADLVNVASSVASEAKDCALKTLQEVLPAAAPVLRKVLRKAERRLKQGLKLHVPEIEPAMDEAFASVNQALSRFEEECGTYRQLYDAAGRATSAVLREIAQSPRFQEAIIWQNHHAFHTGIRPFLRARPFSRNSKARQREQLIIKYLQRYSVKNESIGFFGPMSWVRLCRTGPTVARPITPETLASRSTYFEVWAIDVIADALSRDKSLKPWMAPRRLPHIGLWGNILILPEGQHVHLSPEYARLLATCTGERPAMVIARELLADPGLNFSTTQEALALLEYFEDRGLIAWRFEIPVALYPLRMLRELLEKIEPMSLRRRAIVGLIEFERARLAVEDSAGNATPLIASLDKLDDTFRLLTGHAPERLPGETYAARGLVYEDCQRDVDVLIGPDLIARLDEPLSLLLTSARWFTHKVATRYRSEFEQIYSRLVGASGETSVPLLRFLSEAQHLFTTAPGTRSSPQIIEAERELTARWSSIIGLPSLKHEVQLRASSIRPAVEELFSCSGPGWGLARRHSPDVLIAAKSARDFAEGRYRLVLGEFHIASATYMSSCFVSQHPNAQRLLLLQERDLPDPVVIIGPGSSLRRQRTSMAALPARTFYVEVDSELSAPPGKQSLIAGNLLVDKFDHGLCVRDRDGEHRFEILDFFGYHLSMQTLASLRVWPQHTHTPRLTIDNLVVERERWSFPPAELEFAKAVGEHARYLEARQWATHHEIPRFFFVRPPKSVEQKPIYCDLHSPIYMELLVKLVRRTLEVAGDGARICITEMLPDISHCWVEDDAGSRYTSELRMTLLDPLPPAFGRLGTSAR